MTHTTSTPRKTLTDRLYLNRYKLLALTAVLISLLPQACNTGEEATEAEKLAVMQMKDSLANEIRITKDQFAIIQIEKNHISEALDKSNIVNRQLLDERASGNRKLKLSAITISEQKERINSLTAKNDSLLFIINSLQTRMDEMNRKIVESEKKTENLTSDISNLNGSIIEKDLKIEAVSKEMVTSHAADSVSKIPVFIGIADLSGSTGLGATNVPYADHYLGGSILLGFEYSKRFMGGIGVGLYSFNGGVMSPVFVEFRYGTSGRSFNPYVFSEAGVMVCYGDKSLSNIFVNPGIGIRHALSENFALDLGTGLLIHTTGDPKHNSFVNFKLGIIYSKSRVSTKNK